MDWRAGKGEILELNLLDPKHIWKTSGDTNISQLKDGLHIAVTTNKTEKQFNRAFLTTELSLQERPQLLTLEYSSNSINGSGIFLIEIRDSINNKILWSNGLLNTKGQLSNEKFILPMDIVNKPLEFRLYIITNGPGEHTLIVKKASLPFL